MSDDQGDEDPREPVGVKEVIIVALVFVIVLMFLDRLPK